MTPNKEQREQARDYLIRERKNTCVCDCLPCKTSSCFECELGQFRPSEENNALCCEDDIESLASLLATVEQEGYDRGLERGAQIIESGRFLHDDAPDARFGRAGALAIRREICNKSGQEG